MNGDSRPPANSAVAIAAAAGAEYNVIGSSNAYFTVANPGRGPRRVVIP